MTVTKRPPDGCNICTAPIRGEFVDGRTALGSWADLCPKCWRVYGCGRLGTGCGQRYVVPSPTDGIPEGFYVKAEG